MRKNSIPVATPWGPSQTQDDIAPGITFYSTAGHGGLYLSAPRWADLVSSFAFTSFAGPQWLEEDEDYNLAVLRWPEHFRPQMVFGAVRYVSKEPDPDPEKHFPGWADNMKGARAWLAGPGGEPARRIAEDFAASVAGQWERGGMSTDGGAWMVHFYRGEESALGLMDYPEKVFYTDAELAPFIAAADAFLKRKARELVAAESRRLEALAAEKRRRAAAESIYDLDASGMCYSDADPGL